VFGAGLGAQLREKELVGPVDTAAALMGFIPASALVELTGFEGRLAQPLVYEGQTDRFEIPGGFRTDFASVPQAFQWLVPRIGAWTLAAILHDWLCVALEHEWRHGQLMGAAVRAPASARDTDGIFRRVLREGQVPWLLRWLIWAAVRWGALGSPYRREGWLRDLPLVLVVTVPALPFVGLVSLGAGLVLGLAWLIERVS
jgi:hypothetical protein